ncbi:hypothetical protein C8R44DRAFT_774121 [Mycena epipterygia]|nr:hypothetical protein C8R44DRAFT_774121 [Mycena epipterygia]
MDIHSSRGGCMLRLGDIAEHKGDLVKAAAFWKAARPLFEQSSQTKDMAQIDTKLVSLDQDLLYEHQTTLAHLHELKVPATAVSTINPLSTLNLETKNTVPENREEKTHLVAQ